MPPLGRGPVLRISGRIWTESLPLGPLGHGINKRHDHHALRRPTLTPCPQSAAVGGRARDQAHQGRLRSAHWRHAHSRVPRQESNGRVPTLEEDGFVLRESPAILKYLAAKRPDRALGGSDPKAQALVDHGSAGG